MRLDKKFISERNAADCVTRYLELEKEVQINLPKLVELKKYTLFLKQKLETYLTAYFKRPVVITGEVNKL